MSQLTNSFNTVTAPLLALCQTGPSSSAAMKSMLQELKDAADALSANLAAQIATIP
jgi:methyl-accepting chemotaxis protein